MAVVKVNIERDRTSIYELMELSEKSNSILSKRPEVERFWDKELNGVLNPELIEMWSDRNKLSIDNYSYGSNETVFWKCDKCHGEYEMRIAEKAIKKAGCPYCNNRKLLKGFNDLASCNKELSEEFDVEKNGILPSEVEYGGHEVFWWRCHNGHSYQAQMINRKKGNGCPVCVGKRRWETRKQNKTTNV